MMKSPSLKKYLTLSIFLHLLVVGGFYLLGISARTNIAQDKLEIDILNADDFQKLQAQTKVEDAQPKKKLQEHLTNQVIEQDSLSKTKEEVDSRFLSENNQKVKKQTVAIDRGEFQNLKKSDTKKAGADKASEKIVEKNTPKPSQHQITKDLFKTYDHDEALERQKINDRQIAQKDDLGNPGNGDGNNGGDRSQTNDYIKDVDQGLETLLNTREFKYYSYYNRIRKQLAQHWEGRVREKLSKMFNEGRAPASVESDRITKLMIVLNSAGTLVKVQVLRDSGISDLDDAAIEAFRAAAPFPNPPKGIIESDGTVKIRWDFVIES